MALAPSQLVNHVLSSTQEDSELHKWICDLASSNAAESPTGLVIPFYVLDPDHEEAALLTILRYAFATSPSLRSLILISETTLPLSQPFLLSYFTDTGNRGPGGETAYSSTREAVCPAMTVRQAVVEDTDDLVPLVEGAVDKFGSLAKVQSLPSKHSVNKDSVYPTAENSDNFTSDWSMVLVGAMFQRGSNCTGRLSGRQGR